MATAASSRQLPPATAVPFLGRARRLGMRGGQ
jgi:hypothetical protein